MHSCTWKKVPPLTSCATTVFDVAAAKDTFLSGSSAVIEMDTDSTSYQIADDVDAATSGKSSYVVASRQSEGEVPQQQCVIESNGGESIGETNLGPTTAVQVDLDVTGATMTLGITGVEVT